MFGQVGRRQILQFGKIAPWVSTSSITLARLSASAAFARKTAHRRDRRGPIAASAGPKALSAQWRDRRLELQPLGCGVKQNSSSSLSPAAGIAATASRRPAPGKGVAEIAGRAAGRQVDDGKRQCQWIVPMRAISPRASVSAKGALEAMVKIEAASSRLPRGWLPPRRGLVAYRHGSTRRPARCRTAGPL